MNHLHRYIQQIVYTLNQLPQLPLRRIADALWETYERDGTIIVCGNGGSASTASHFACDLTKWTIRDGARRVRSLALTDNMALLTAWSNDQGYADVFVEQLRSLYRPGDLVFAISGSGKSPNVLRAIQWANEMGAPTIGITGFDGGMLDHLAQTTLHVDNQMMPQVEDIHSTVCHALAVNLGYQIEEMMSHTLEVAPAGVLLERVIGGGSV
ncbi:SIS domain-containing protein [Candidatus Chloroploca sp. M-50]|uniref:SIS domain-containing protein n=1 Tax=Candidatus Chloroploca mongolica TaxID=2528176 RepID=A0ABS4DBK8_9CHLR|nr:SIS domain-containing protein [Candidatus Chloroploca mongolica]MBP1466833.1 SIS domain-containing protein [Candidatus Chloroploca mongolica]